MPLDLNNAHRGICFLLTENTQMSQKPQRLSQLLQNNGDKGAFGLTLTNMHMFTEKGSWPPQIGVLQESRCLASMAEIQKRSRSIGRTDAVLPNTKLIFSFEKAIPRFLSNYSNNDSLVLYVGH